MTPEEVFAELPIVAVDEEATTPGGMTYVSVGPATFCVEEDLAHGDWWGDVKILIAYCQYLDQVKAERGL